MENGEQGIKNLELVIDLLSPRCLSAGFAFLILHSLFSIAFSRGA
jgi:hypothetical protein